MIIWSGWGILGILIPGAMVFVMELIAAAMGQAAGHTWPVALGLLAGAGIVYLISQRLSRPGRTLIDPQTGQTLVIQRRDSLFFIPLKWIAVIVAVLGLFFLVAPNSKSASTAPAATSTVVSAG